MLPPICARRRFSRTPFELRAPIESLESRRMLSCAMHAGEVTAAAAPFVGSSIKVAYVIARYPGNNPEHTVSQSVTQHATT